MLCRAVLAEHRNEVHFCTEGALGWTCGFRLSRPSTLPVLPSDGWRGDQRVKCLLNGSTALDSAILRVRRLMLRPHTVSLILLISLVSAPLLAQTGRIEGTVRSAQTRDPIANVQIEVVGTDFSVATNENGYYVVANVPAGTYTVRVRAVGYREVTLGNQRIAAGLPTTVNFELQASILRIEGVVVTGTVTRTTGTKLPFEVS